MTNLYEALLGDPAKEIPLGKPPLVRVIGQIRFPAILTISNPDSVAKFQEHVRGQYPILESMPIPHVKVDVQTGTPTVEVGKVWTFYDTEKKWRISLTNDFIALDTLNYSSRSNFTERFNFIISSLNRSFGLQVIQRVGLRYINVIQKPQVDNINELLIPEVVGLHNHTEISNHIVHSLTDTVLRGKDGSIRIRWGSLAEGITFDPENIIPPQAGSYWVIDMDMSDETEHPFDEKDLNFKINSYAERIYTIFRWCVKDKFLSSYGASDV